MIMVMMMLATRMCWKLSVQTGQQSPKEMQDYQNRSDFQECGKQTYGGDDSNLKPDYDRALSKGGPITPRRPTLWIYS